MRVSIRLASKRDLDAIKDLYRVAVSEQECLKPGWAVQADWGSQAFKVIEATVLQGVLEGFPVTTFVCDIDSVIVGYAIASLEPFPGGVLDGKSMRLRLRHLFVDEEARGVGVGEVLLAAAAKWGRARGAGVCEVEVLPGHRAAKNFCEAHALKARAITMSGLIEEVLGCIELDSDEASMIDACVRTALERSAHEIVDQRSIAAGCVVVQEGRVLVARRSERPFEGYWSIPGGIPEPGETLLECARRELEEETGIHAEIIGIAGVAERFWGRSNDGPKHFTIVNFLALPAMLSSATSLKTNLDADTDAAWVLPESIPEPSVPGVAEFLRLIKPAVEASMKREPLPPAVYSPPAGGDF